MRLTPAEEKEADDGRNFVPEGEKNIPKWERGDQGFGSGDQPRSEERRVGKECRL